VFLNNVRRYARTENEKPDVEPRYPRSRNWIARGSMRPRRISPGRHFPVSVGASLCAFAFLACQGPEAFYRGDGDATVSGVAGATHLPDVEGAGGTTGAGTLTGVAGSPGRGGATATGRGGTGGMGRGGSTGAGRGGAGGVGRGGSTGAGRGGAGGMGRGGAGGMGRGGATGMGRGGATGMGRGGATGITDGGARDGATGVDAGGRGGAPGPSDGGPRDGATTVDAGRDVGGDSGPTGTGPCAGLCSNPGMVAPGTASGDLGTEATCDEVVGNVTHLVCGNFVAPRTLKVNNVTVSCAGGGVALPAARNGGWCMQASAGQYSYAYFNSY
jgi:hypothetical protein